MTLRPLGTTGLEVSSVALGGWPIAGLTSRGATEADGLATVRACLDLGINFIDTAYCYGVEGESERLIGKALGDRRDEVVIATKGGIHYGPNRQQVINASPVMLRRECEESLRRLATDRVELYYLHVPDPKVPIAESAGEIRRLLEEGKVRSVGVSNMTLEQIQQFTAVCPIVAFQQAYNMLQREIERDTLPWCRHNNISMMAYWPLLKGLLAGRLTRDQVLPPGDGRLKYPMFRGDEWQKNHDLIDALRPLAAETGHSVAQLVINWTIHQPGITSALCGAKRPDQVRENAGAMGWELSAEQIKRVDEALASRGTPITQTPL